MCFMGHPRHPINQHADDAFSGMDLIATYISVDLIFTSNDGW